MKTNLKILLLTLCLLSACITQKREQSRGYLIPINQEEIEFEIRELMKIDTFTNSFYYEVISRQNKDTLDVLIAKMVDFEDLRKEPPYYYSKINGRPVLFYQSSSEYQRIIHEYPNGKIYVMSFYEELGGVFEADSSYKQDVIDFVYPYVNRVVKDENGRFISFPSTYHSLYMNLIFVKGQLVARYYNDRVYNEKFGFGYKD